MSVRAALSRLLGSHLVLRSHGHDGVTAGDHRKLAYTLSFGGEAVAGQESARAIKTFMGDGNRTGGGAEEGAYRIIVDFAGGPLDALGAEAPVVSAVSASGGGDTEIIEHYVEFIEADNNWRLSMLVRPGAGADPVIRGQLRMDTEPLTEVWSYSLSEAVRNGQSGP